VTLLGTWLPIAGEVPWTLLVGLGALSVLLSLEDTSLAQTWLSQPLPAGILAGLVCGDPQTGLAIGLPFQLVTIGNLPVGQVTSGEQVGAVVAAVGGTVASGNRLLWPFPPEPGAAGLLGWVLLGTVLLSLAGHWAVRGERRVHFLWMLAGGRSLREGNLGRFERIHGLCLGITALRGLLLALCWLGVMILLWIPLYAWLPGRLVRALAYLPLLTPPLAVGLMLDRYGFRSGWGWVLAGLAAAFLAVRLLG